MSLNKLTDFLKEKDNDFNPNLDGFNPNAVGYNQAIKDVIRFMSDNNIDEKKLKLTIRYSTLSELWDEKSKSKIHIQISKELDKILSELKIK